MEFLNLELLRIWEILGVNNVRFIIVGDYASRLHGLRGNRDTLEVWLEDTLENRRNLIKSFEQLGYGQDFSYMETLQFVPGWTSFQIGSGIEIDIMTTMKGLETLSFDECLNLASIADLDTVQVPFLHINHLIQNKKTVDRPKDKIDVIELEKIRKIREEN